MKKLLLKSVLLLCALVAGSGTMWAAVTWTRVTSVQTLLDGGTFIMGYEATAKSGVIVPMANSGSATTSTAGFMYSGSTAASGGSGTINMSSVTTTSSFEVVIGESSVVDGAIYIKIGNNYLGNTNTKNNCKLFTSEATTTSFTPTVGTNDNFTLDIAANTSGSAYRYLKYNTSSPRFAVYSTKPEKIVFYKKVETPAAPTFDLTAGTYAGSRTLNISAATGCTLKYTTDNTAPATSGTATTVNTNTVAVSVSSSMTVRAIAIKGGVNSDETSATYTITAVSAASVPEFSRVAGEYAYGTTVELTSTNAAYIIYTTDGSTPSYEPLNGTEYTAPIAINGDMTIKAIAVDDNEVETAVAERSFTVVKPTAPTFSLAEGSYIGSQTVTISSPASTIISYTTDGTDPAESGTATVTDTNSAAVNVTSTTTIRAITIDAHAIESAEATAEYTIVTPETMPFEEDFNNSKGDFTINNVSGYASVWTTNSGYIKASAYSSGNKTNNAAESWLISPFITIAANAQLTFKHSTRYFNNVTAMKAEATLWYRELNGAWQQLTIDEYPGNSNLNTFVTATIDLSTLAGKNIQLGFKYLGNTTSAGSWEIKNLVLEAVTPAPTFTLSASSADLTIPTAKMVDITLTTNTDGEITATSDDTEIATVALKSAGVYTITAVADGSATITISAAKSASYKAASATVDVTVTDNREAAGISFSKSSATVNLGDALTPPTFSNPNSLTVSFSSTGEDVATVDGSGNVTIVDFGTTTIKATFAGNDAYKPAVASYDLTVKNPYQDVITVGDITFSGSSSYCNWTSVANVNSGATYTGNSNYSTSVIQFRTSSNSGMITTGTAGRVTKVAVTWGSSTGNGKKIDIYGKNTAYTAVGDLFDNDKQGTKLGSITKGTSTELSITGNYAYIGIRSNDGALYLDDITIDWQTKETVSIGASKYASFCSDCNIDFTSADVKAYKAKVNEGRVVLTEVKKVPANTGVILYSEVAGSYDIPLTASADPVTENELVGVTERTQVNWQSDGKYNYILQSGQFNKATTGYLKANLAYLHTSYDVTAAGARPLEIVFDDDDKDPISTSVDDVRSKVDEARGDVFDLQGRKVSQPQKGLYIVNGKKVVIK